MASCPGKATPDGTCNRDYIYIVDLAQAHILALQPGKQGFYNLGSGGGYSVRQVIKMCEELPAARHPRSRSPADPAILPSSLKDIIQTAWAWHKRHPQG